LLGELKSEKEQNWKNPWKKPIFQFKSLFSSEPRGAVRGKAIQNSPHRRNPNHLNIRIYKALCCKA
jgi:hypothetical protein